MKCAKCGKVTEFVKPRSYGSGAGIVIDASITHADREQWAWYCEQCDKVYCGECCYPQWQTLKKKEGLGGRELAAKLERTPDACFFELATCPACSKGVDSQYTRPGFVARLLKRVRGQQRP